MKHPASAGKFENLCTVFCEQRTFLMHPFNSSAASRKKKKKYKHLHIPEI